MRPTLTKSVCSTIRNAKCVRAEKPGKCCSNVLEGQRGKSCWNNHWQHMCPPDELSAQNTALLKRRRRSPNANGYYNSSAWEPVSYVLEKPGRHLLKRKVESMAFLWLANIPNGTIIPKQPVKHLPTRDSSGRVREKLKYCKKCQKWLLKQARKCMCHCVGHLLRRTITSARGHGWTELSGLNLPKRRLSTFYWLVLNK